MERPSIGVETDRIENAVTANDVIISEKTIQLLESLIETSRREWDLLSKLDQFHIQREVQLIQVKSQTITPWEGEELEAVSMVCGASGRVAVLVGSSSHDSWCSHLGGLIVVHRSKNTWIPQAVCPSSGGWSSQGLLAIGAVDGTITLISNSSVLSINQLHEQSVSSLLWSRSELFSCSIDGHLVVSVQKGTQLEVVRDFLQTTRLIVSDLPRQIRGQSTSSKPLAIVSMEKNGKELCVASETGGIWIISMDTLQRKTIDAIPQAINLVFPFDNKLAIAGEGESVQLSSVEGEFLDVLPIGATLIQRHHSLLICGDREKFVFYDLESGQNLGVQRILNQAAAFGPSEDLVVLDAEFNLVTYRIQTL